MIDDRLTKYSHCVVLAHPIQLIQLLLPAYQKPINCMVNLLRHKIMIQSSSESSAMIYAIERNSDTPSTTYHPKTYAKLS